MIDNRARHRAADRAANSVRRAAIALGRRHLVALIDTLAGYAAMGDVLPMPGQGRLAKDLRCHPETIGRQVRELERLGLVKVYRSPARPDPAKGGRWSRSTNRYLLCTRRAVRIARDALLRPRQHARRVNPVGTNREGPHQRGRAPSPVPEWLREQINDPPPAEKVGAPIPEGRRAAAAEQLARIREGLRR